MSALTDSYLQQFDEHLAMLQSGARFDDARHTLLARSMADKRLEMNEDEVRLVDAAIEEHKRPR